MTGCPSASADSISPMQRVKIVALKNPPSQHSRAEEQGAGIEITDRHRPIVRWVPGRSAES
jgi:hypothetical protein